MALRSHCKDFMNNLVRKKNITEDITRKDLKKVLKLSDLTFLAVGSMIGSGLYVLTGAVARIAGPSIVISYFLAAVASILSAVCYAEFAARVPVTGSAYQYTYLSIGEIWAFVVGWNVFLEHTVLAASIAKGWSGYVDGLCGFAISTFLKKHLPMPGGLVAEYPDFLAGMLVILLTLIVARGVKVSSTVNIFFAAVNLTVIVFIFCTGMYLAKGEYWQGEKTFFPHGWSGTISGAATLIFSYVGYEVVATATEESVNPKRDVPLSLLISLSVVVVAYVGVSTALTLMVPWDLISVSSPFPNAYHFRGWDWAGYVVSIGALAAMTAAMLSALLVIPRYLYAMARDGLLWRFLDVVNDDTGVPVTATAISGGFCLLLTLMFGLVALVEFISVGQLLACTFVSICVVKLRYGPSDVSSYETLADDGEPTPQDAGQSTNLSTSLPECQTSSKASSNTEETPLTSLKSEAGVGATQYQTTAVAEAKCPGTIKEFVLEANCDRHAALRPSTPPPGLVYSSIHCFPCDCGAVTSCHASFPSERHYTNICGSTSTPGSILEHNGEYYTPIEASAAHLAEICGVDVNRPVDLLLVRLPAQQFTKTR
ncbi:unnamed protein product [Clavelina lepadiformis]|uniref:Cationic amino acid transporter 4 n=1 Tax=Clavelina lepadiformis TaxID=159417 RepID=A0ABP0FXS5_CLALP